MSTTSEIFTQRLDSSQVTQFSNTLGSYVLLDIGWINAVDADGYASVSSNKLVGSTPVVYRHVEVLNFGSSRGGFFNAATNTPCILISPASAVSDTVTQVLNIGTSPYSSKCIKAIPLCGTHAPTVSAGFNSAGAFSIHTPVFDLLASDTQTDMNIGSHTSVSVSDNSIALLTANRLINIIIDVSGNTRVIYFTSSGYISRMCLYKVDGSYALYKGSYSVPTAVELADIDNYTRWTWVDIFNMDGSYSKTMYDGSGNILTRLNISNDGTTGAQVGATSITFSANGQVSISTGAATTINSGGALDIVASGSVTINNHLEVTQ